MSHLVVASQFVLSDYPGMRAGRIYSGKPDLFKRPKGEAHVVDGPDATETLCGISRDGFPHDCTEATTVDQPFVTSPCATCRDLAARG
jgi:hypothetical protein